MSNATFTVTQPKHLQHEYNDPIMLHKLPCLKSSGEYQILQNQISKIYIQETKFSQFKLLTKFEYLYCCLVYPQNTIQRRSQKSFVFRLLSFRSPLQTIFSL